MKYLPGDLIFYRRFQHPADLPANSMLDYPRLRTARWCGPARVLACETKVDGASRRPSSMFWAIAAGRLKKFHARQVRRASESEKLVSNASSAPTFRWTFNCRRGATTTSRSPKVEHGEDHHGSRPRPRSPRRKPASPEEEPLPQVKRVPQHVRDAPSDEEMVPDREESAKRPPPDGQDEELDIDRLLDDVTYLPSGQPGPVSFQEQRASHERSDR